MGRASLGRGLQLEKKGFQRPIIGPHAALAAKDYILLFILR